MKILATIIVILLAGLGVFYFGPFHHQTSTPDPHVDLVAPANAPAASEDPPLIDALQSSLRDKESEARISSLLAAGANANVTDKTGRPALSLAVRNNDLDALAALLKAGADPNQRDKEMQWTPLMYASFQTARDPAFLKVVELLLEKGADVHANKDGTTALHVAINNLDAKANDVRIVEVLLKAGANPNGEPTTNSAAFTLSPLLAATIGGKNTAAITLAKNGADLTAPKGGKSPSQTAKDNHHPELAAQLEKLEKAALKTNKKAPPPKKRR